MKTKLVKTAGFLQKTFNSCCFMLIMLLIVNSANGQAPVISYPGPQSYSTGVTIAPLSPTNSGGAVSPTVIDILGGGFNYPVGVALDAAKNIYVADGNNNVVKKIPAGGGTPITIGSGFNYPSGIAADAAGDVFVADEYNNLLKEIPADGSAIVTIGPTFNRPNSIALDHAGNIYVGDRDGIKKMPPGGGTPVLILAITPGNGVFAMTLDNAGNIFYIDAVANQIKEKLVAGGSSIVIASEPQDASGSAIDGVALDAAGNVYYPDINYNYITKVSHGSSQKTRIGSGFSVPVGIALDGQGKIYFCDYTANNVSRITVGGYFISPALPKGLNLDPNTGVISGTPNLPSPSTNYTITAIGASGNGSATINLTVMATVKPVISYSAANVYHKNTKIAALVPVNTGGAITTEKTLVAASTPGFPYGVAIDATGNIYYTENQNKDVRVLPAWGGPPKILATGIDQPLGIAADGAGSVFVNNGDTAIVKIFASWNRQVFTFDSGSFPAGAMATDTSGNLYTASNGGQKIIKINSTGGPPKTLATLDNLFVPQGIAVDRVGNIYLTDNRSGRIIELKGGARTVVNLATTNTALVGAAVDASGNLYFIDQSSHSLCMYVAATGGIITLVNGGFGESFELALDASRNIYSAVASAKQIIKITTSGYYLDKPLPAGLVMDKATGMIHGTPTATSPATTYNVTALNSAGCSTSSFSLKVSGNSPLSNLVPGVSHLGVAFAPGKFNYAMSVAGTVSSISFTPTTADSTSSVTVNGVTVVSGTASPGIPLAIGNNAVQVIVTAADGSETTYLVSVKRLVSSNAKLAHLVISRGVLTPTFNTATTSYAASVGNAITSVTVTPTTADATATVTVNGTAVSSGTASAPITLANGPNSITTVVTAQDGTTTMTYTVTITRAGGGGINTIYDAVSVERPLSEPQIQNDGIIVHQGLSPNGDGINDFLLIDGIANYPANKLQIMTRNGQLIFEAKNYDNSTKVFDGHSNKTGQMQLPGTYFYSLDYTVKGEVKHKTGFVVLKY